MWPFIGHWQFNETRRNNPWANKKFKNEKGLTKTINRNYRTEEYSEFKNTVAISNFNP